jgi:hypothetical protein
VTRKDVFSRATARAGKKWWSFHRVAWLSKRAYWEKPIDELREELVQKLDDFVRDDLPVLEKALEPIATALLKRHRPQHHP